MTPSELLDAAGRLLDQPTPSMRQCWQRSCACLTRVALEQGLEQYWHRMAPSLANRPMRHQLIALPSFTGPEVARHLCAVWNGLSRAMHHHAYELPPTVAELYDWRRSVAQLLTDLNEE
jgi:hypothetical protein